MRNRHIHRVFTEQTVQGNIPASTMKGTENTLAYKQYYSDILSAV
jgi:hypothetical protein